jgi:TonB family protein
MGRYALLFLAAWTVAAQTDTEWTNRGVQAFKNARYGEAIEAFQRAVDANPGNVTPRLYLATAHMQQYIPGAESPENVAHAERAFAEFERVLAMDPGNKMALSSLASLELNRKRFEEARAWYKKLLVVDPANASAYYSIGFSIWAEWYPAYSHARTQAGLSMEAPGPIPDAAVRNSLRAQWWPALDDAIFNLKRALDLNPDYSDAMAYMNLFIRERADLEASKQEYVQQVAEADQWVQRALEAKRKMAAAGQQNFGPPPPPPPPPPPGSGAGGPTPQRIKVGGNVQSARLVNRVDAVYPALARQAQVQGAVRLSVVIGKDGRVSHIEVQTGHPLLVPAAIEAVRQWAYQPTLLNGNPVEVATDVEVNFTLGN